MEPIIAYIGETIQVGDTIKVPVKDDPMVARSISMMNAEIAALQGGGFSDDQVKFNVVKDWMESGAYTSTGSKVNNPGNIMYGKHNINAHKGPYLEGNKTYLAAYSSLGDYARDLKRVLSLSPGKPYEATGYPDLRDFVHRLALNHYFGKESEVSYLNKMKGAQQRLRIITDLQVDSHQDLTTDTPKDKFMTWWDNLSTTEKVGIGVAAFTGIAILTKR
jgi:hypothetical protein